jgi:hypothetical protein
MKKKLRKKHHYTPRFLMEYFSDESTKMLWVNDRKTGAVFKSASANCSVIQGFYHFEMMNGQTSESVEEWLGAIESLAAPVIRRINDGDVRLSEDDWERIMYFMSAMKFRNPKHRENIENFHRRRIALWDAMFVADKSLLESHVRRMEEDTGKKVDVSVDALYDFIKQGRYTIEVGSVESMRHITELTQDIFWILDEMNWSIASIEYEEDEFILGDNPVVLVNDSVPPGTPIGLKMRHTEVQFPVGPKKCIIGTWENLYGFTRPLISNSTSVAGVNRGQMAHAHRQVFSRRKPNQKTPPQKK